MSIGEVEAGLNAGSILLLDARERSRFRGEQEPIDAVAGHIPGAVNAPFNENLDGDGRFLAVSALSERFTRIVNQRAPDSVVCMCGSGVSACHNLFAMELAGLGQGTLYVGSWSEWIRSGNRPIATA